MGENTQRITRVKRAAEMAQANLPARVILLKESRFKLSNLIEAARHIEPTPHTEHHCRDYKALLEAAQNRLNEIQV